MVANHIAKIERKQNEYGWFLSTTYEDGHNNCWGFGQTDRGSKRMLTIHTKRHGLEKTDENTAVKK